MTELDRQCLYHHVRTAQDNNLAEALKARNLLAEFDTSTETALPAPLPRGGAVPLLPNYLHARVPWRGYLAIQQSRCKNSDVSHVGSGHVYTTPQRICIGYSLCHALGEVQDLSAHQDLTHLVVTRSYLTKAYGLLFAGDVHINVADVAKPMPDVASKRLFRRRTGPQPVALVGFREWIFSENSGAGCFHTVLPPAGPSTVCAPESMPVLSRFHGCLSSSTRNMKQPKAYACRQRELTKLIPSE